MTCLALWSAASLDSKIAINSHKTTQARAAAQSGISHFMELNLNIEDSHYGVVIPETQLGPRVSYIVEVYASPGGRIMLLSKGLYRKGEEVLYQYPIRAVAVKQ